MKHSVKVLAYTIFACILWSTAFVSIKIGLSYAAPIQLAGLRFMLAGFLVVPFLRNFRVNLGEIWRNKYQLLRLSFFQTFGLYGLFHLGVDKVSASVSALIVGAGPLFIGILASIMKHEKMTRRKAVAIAIGFSGIAVIAFGRMGGLLQAQASWAGIGILLLSNISGSTGNILISKTKINVHPLFQNAFQMFVGGVALYLFSFIFETGHFKPQPAEFYFALLWLGIIAAGGFSLWFLVLNMPGVKVSEISVWKFILPVLGAMLAWFILPDEKPELIVIIGMFMVSLSLVVMYYKRRI
ncbi:MAG: EamA family transporter [Bacteroidales bacterium]|nr:EamA family transporter [Bacteroidales bacterium]